MYSSFSSLYRLIYAQGIYCARGSTGLYLQLLRDDVLVELVTTQIEGSIHRRYIYSRWYSFFLHRALPFVLSLATIYLSYVANIDTYYFPCSSFYGSFVGFVTVPDIEVFLFTVRIYVSLLPDTA